MNFPDTNHKTIKPIPKVVESNIKKLEEYLSKIKWVVFFRFYFVIVACLLVTVFAFIVTIGIANAIVNIFK